MDNVEMIVMDDLVFIFCKMLKRRHEKHANCHDL